MRHDVFNMSIVRHLYRFGVKYDSFNDKTMRPQLKYFMEHGKPLEDSDLYVVEQTYNPRTCKRGRLFSDNPSLQGMKRILRNTIADGKLTDFDFVNCHPTLVTQYCR